MRLLLHVLLLAVHLLGLPGHALQLVKNVFMPLGNLLHLLLFEFMLKTQVRQLLGVALALMGWHFSFWQIQPESTVAVLLLYARFYL